MVSQLLAKYNFILRNHTKNHVDNCENHHKLLVTDFVGDSWEKSDSRQDKIDP